MGTDPRLLVSLVRSKSKCLVPSLLTMGQHVHDLSHREGVKRCEKHARQDHQGVGMSWMTQLRGPSARNICTSSCYHDEKMLRRCGGWGLLGSSPNNNPKTSSSRAHPGQLEEFPTVLPSSEVLIQKPLTVKGPEGGLRARVRKVAMHTSRLVVLYKRLGIRRRS